MQLVQAYTIVYVVFKDYITEFVFILFKYYLILYNKKGT